MEKNRSTKVIAIIALLVAILGVTIVFALMDQPLNISGTARVVPEGSWDIHFANDGVGDFIQTNIPTGSDAISNVNPTLSATNITGIDVTLTKPGDKVEYIFNVVNGGILDAVIDTVTPNTPIFTGTGPSAASDQTIVSENLIFNLKYASDYSSQNGPISGAEVAKGDFLPAENMFASTQKLILTVAYKNPPDGFPGMPTAPVTVTGLGMTILYVQG